MIGGKEMYYENDTILLRPFTRKDMTEKYCSWFHNPHVTKYNSHGLFPYTEKKMELFIENIEGNGDDIVWAIIAKGKTSLWTSGSHIGNCSLQSINWIYRSCEIAFVLGDTDYWGKGYATQAGKYMLFHAFQRMNMNRCWTGTVNTNKGMRRVAEKIGMKKEGVFRQGAFIDGKYEDIICYSILQEEYQTNNIYEKSSVNYYVATTTV